MPAWSKLCRLALRFGAQTLAVTCNLICHFLLDIHSCTSADRQSQVRHWGTPESASKQLCSAYRVHMKLEWQLPLISLPTASRALVLPGVPDSSWLQLSLRPELLCQWRDLRSSCQPYGQPFRLTDSISDCRLPHTVRFWCHCSMFASG